MTLPLPYPDVKKGEDGVDADGVQRNFEKISLEWPAATGFLTDQDTTTRDGSLSGEVAYTEATITLTPGTWLVEAFATLLNLTATDSCCVGIWNATTNAEVTSSRGPASVATTTLCCGVVSGAVQIVVTANTDVCPYACRNGASTLRVYSAAGAPAGKITARRLA